MEINSQPAIGEQASTSGETSQQVEQAKEAPPLTEERLRQIAREEATRVSQSLVDKAEHRISTKAREQIDALKSTASVLNLTQDEVDAATNKIVLNDLRGAAEPASPAPATTHANSQEEIHPAVAAVLEICDAEQMQLNETDPEWAKYVKPVWTSASGTIPALRKVTYQAIEAKRQRLSSNTDAAQSRIVSGGQAQTTGSADMTGREYLQRAHKK